MKDNNQNSCSWSRNRVSKKSISKQSGCTTANMVYEKIVAVRREVKNRIFLLINFDKILKWTILYIFRIKNGALLYRVHEISKFPHDSDFQSFQSLRVSRQQHKLAFGKEPFRNHTKLYLVTIRWFETSETIPVKHLFHERMET